MRELINVKGAKEPEVRDCLFFSMDITSDKIVFLNVLAHEIAHQWLGNLATCHWWSDVWLNEGFSNYFSSYVMNKVIFPRCNLISSTTDEPVTRCRLRWTIRNSNFGICN